MSMRKFAPALYVLTIMLAARVSVLHAQPPTAEEASRILKTMPSRVVLALMERLQPHVAAEVLQRAHAERCGELLDVDDAETIAEVETGRALGIGRFAQAVE